MYNKENLSIGKPLGEDRGLVALMGIRIFINFDPIRKTLMRLFRGRRLDVRICGNWQNSQFLDLTSLHLSIGDFNDINYEAPASSNSTSNSPKRWYSAKTASWIFPRVLELIG